MPQEKIVIFYGDDIYDRSNSMHSGMATKEGDRRYDFGDLQKTLMAGIPVKIIPATPSERATWMARHKIN